MREILFRGKRFDNGQWVEGGFIHGIKSAEGKSFILPENISVPGWHHLDGFIVIPESVGQFTGLLDNNEKKIFQGDVVYLAGYGDYIAEFPFLDLYQASYENDIGSIKGNIHEVPL